MCYWQLLQNHNYDYIVFFFKLNLDSDLGSYPLWFPQSFLTDVYVYFYSVQPSVGE